MENPSDWQTAREKEPELWDRYSKAQGAMFGAFFALAEKFKTDEDFAKMSTLQTYANFAGAARDVIANLDAAKARSVVEKTKEMMNAYKPYYQLLGTAETIQKVPDTQALDALLK